MRQKTHILLIILLIYILTGCVQIKTPEELIRIPKSAVADKEIAMVIKEWLGEDKVLTISAKQPGEAIRKVDLDDDGVMELSILYREVDPLNSSSERYGMLILKKQDDKWQEINRIVSGLYGFDFVLLEDITGDSKKEICIGYSGDKGMNKPLAIYSYHDDYFRQLYGGSYREVSIKDVNKDGKQEVIVLGKDTQLHMDYIEVLHYMQSELMILYRYDMRNKSYDSTMTLGRASINDLGIFIDHDIGSFSGYTELLIVKDDQLVEVLGGLAKPKGLWGNITKSEDINHDGIIEFGLITDKGLSKQSNKDPNYIKEWYQWDGDKKVSLIQREYENYRDNYKIIIPLEWKEQFAITSNEDEHTVEFYKTEDEEQVLEGLFAIRSYSITDWIKKSERLDYEIVLHENKHRVIVGSLFNHQGKTIHDMTLNKLQEMFSLL